MVIKSRHQSGHVIGNVVDGRSALLDKVHAVGHLLHEIVNVWFESPEVKVEREVWAYPTISFIADLGGALSLFVGVSLLSAWDCLEYLIRKYKQQ